MKRAFSATITAAIVLFSASPAHASNHWGQEGGYLTILGLYGTTTIGLPITSAGITTGGAVSLTVATQDKGVAMKRFLEHNATAIQADVTLGTGPTIDDLASAYNVPDSRRASFAKMIRLNRGRLLELADPERLTAARALAFTRLIYVLGRTGEIIDADFERA